MFTLKFDFASPGGGKKCTAPCLAWRRGRGAAAPGGGNIHGIRRGGREPRREAPGPGHCVCIGLWKSHFANFLPSACT
ncbi:hypothetical protein A6R68_21902 [Neotoma lepida]|uniref:Uncharacterized protein n=1 Tax=Neotoma lepida TaxID=56216 RepID=A0A1A6HPH6_NEOLE|nr:hypothetical protein A6R68_21902 [Neotoma lepida]